MSDNTYENVNPEMIRKRKAKAQETPEQRQARLNRESERKRQKRAKESENKRNERLESLRKRRNNKKEMEKDDERVIRLAHESNRKRVLRTRNKNQLQDQQINEQMIMNIFKESLIIETCMSGQHRLLLLARTITKYCRNFVTKWITSSIILAPNVTNGSLI
ncbi:unnamed protein product [Rhizophagus irregularis]|nr:unnamed protein product [Rhizophagus irregularis]